MADSLANLQLLEGTANIEKQAELPAEWLQSQFETQEGRSNYRDLHALGVVPAGLDGFETFSPIAGND